MKKFTILLIFMIAMMTIAAFAQEDAEENNWKLGADFTMNLTQNAYSDNWHGTEQASISWTATGLFTAEKQVSPIANWNNKLKLAYGQTHNSYKEVNEDGEEETKWKKPEKSTDDVDLESIMRFTFNQYVDPYASLRLESQFYDGAENMFNPMTITEAAGIARQFIKKDNQELISRLGFAFRQHLDQTEGVENTNDGGVEFVTDYKHVFPERGLNYVSTLRVFKAIFNSDSDALDEADVEWDAPTLDWENTLSLSIVKYLSVNVYVQMLYDKAKDEDMMFKETMGLGLTYKLF